MPSNLAFFRRRSLTGSWLCAVHCPLAPEQTALFVECGFRLSGHSPATRSNKASRSAKTKRLFERHARCRENDFIGGDYRCSRAVAYQPRLRRSARYHKRCPRRWRFSVQQQPATLRWAQRELSRYTAPRSTPTDAASGLQKHQPWGSAIALLKRDQPRLARCRPTQLPLISEYKLN